ncbi:MAG: VWA domain-containing protein [Alphaproteobacteria bacterium]
MIHFAVTDAFFLLLLPFFIRAFLPAIKGMHGDGLRVPKTFFETIKTIKKESGQFLGISLNEKHSEKIKLSLLFLIYLLLTIALARPQIVGEPLPLKTENREILLVTDISTSMLERDFDWQGRRIDRLTAVKKVVSNFIQKRTNDKIGLILFGTNTYLQAPITFDRNSVEKTLLSMDAGMAGNSTAIGDALGLALKNIKDSNNKNKVIILLTDGENNDGSISVQEAIDLAKSEGIKIYTIGVGSERNIVQSFFGLNIQVGDGGLDEKSLKEIAEVSKGTYFKATDTKSLEKIYEQIDKMEANQNEEKFVQEVRELYHYPLVLALLFSFILVLSVRKTR